MTIQAIEFYSGIGTVNLVFEEDFEALIVLIIGGLHRALQKSNVDATVVRAFDWDQTACRVYEENYGKGSVRKVRVGF